MIRKDTPEYLHSDNGGQFIAKELHAWLDKMDVAPMYILPESP